MVDENQNAINIAKLEERIDGLREQQKTHSDTTKQQFMALNEKVDELLIVMNKGKGAYAAALAIAGSVGAGIVTFFSYVSTLAGQK